MVTPVTILTSGLRREQPRLAGLVRALGITGHHGLGRVPKAWGRAQATKVDLAGGLLPELSMLRLSMAP